MNRYGSHIGFHRLENLQLSSEPVTAAQQLVSTHIGAQHAQHVCAIASKSQSSLGMDALNMTCLPARSASPPACRASAAALSQRSMSSRWGSCQVSWQWATANTRPQAACTCDEPWAQELQRCIDGDTHALMLHMQGWGMKQAQQPDAMPHACKHIRCTPQKACICRTG